MATIAITGANITQIEKYGMLLANHYGCKAILYDWPGVFDAQDYLHFSRIAIVCKSSCLRIINFKQAANEYNRAIKLTDWQYGDPPFIGEWDVEYFPKYISIPSTKARRWWNGHVWSCSLASITQHDMNLKAGTPSILDPLCMRWRGLSEEPILVD